MIHFVGAGPGAADLITMRGARLLQETDIIIYAGSLVNPALLEYAKVGCQIYNSAEMTLEEVIEVMKEAETKGLDTVRLHTGDASLYGAIREQMDALRERGISVIDADELYHSLLVPPSRCLELLREAFGDEIFNDDGTLDRPALARIVFSDEQKLELLNSTVLSVVIDESKKICYNGITKEDRPMRT